MITKLLDRDWRFIVDSLYALNGLSDLSEFEREALARIDVLVPCRQSMFTIINEHDGEPTTFSDIVSHGDQPHYLEEFYQCGFNLDPYFQGWNYFKNPVVFRDTDMMPDDYRVTTEVYKKIYARENVHYIARMYLIDEGHAIGNLSLFRPKSAGDFTERDMCVLETLAPHVTQKLTALLKPAPIMPSGDLTEALSKRHLTSREQEVVLLVLEGLDDCAIADQMGISRATLKTHIYNIYQKASVRNRVQLFSLFSSSGAR